MPYGLDCDLSACSALTVCERLEPDYETALRRARWCGPIDVPAGVPYSYECTTSAPSHPACGCPVHVRNRVELDELARQWLENGCEKAQPCEPCVDFPGELTCGQDGWCRRGE